MIEVLDRSDGDRVVARHVVQDTELAPGGHGADRAWSAGPLAVTTAPLAEGVHALAARVTDTAGNIGAASADLAVTVDLSVASLAGVSVGLAPGADTGRDPADGLTNLPRPELTVSGLDGLAFVAGDVIELRETGGADRLVASHVVTAGDLTGGQWSSGALTLVPPEAFADGVHALVLRVTDTVGATGAESPVFGLQTDTSLPALGALRLDLPAGSDTGASASDNLTRISAPGIAVTGLQGLSFAAGDLIEVIDTTAGDAVLASHVVQASDLSGGLWASGTLPLTLPALADGAHALAVRVSDAAGNSASAAATLTLRIDSAAPILVVAPVAGDDLVNGVEASGALRIEGTALGVGTDRPITVSWGGLDKTVYVTRALQSADGAPNWSVQFSAAQIPADEPASPITVQVADRAGNATQVVQTVGIDRIAPDLALTEIVDPDSGEWVPGSRQPDYTHAEGFAVTSGSAVTVTLNGSALDPAGVAARFEVTTDGGLDTYRARPEAFRGNESVTVSARLADAAGNAAQASLSLRPIDTTGVPGRIDFREYFDETNRAYTSGFRVDASTSVGLLVNGVTAVLTDYFSAVTAEGETTYTAIADRFDGSETVDVILSDVTADLGNVSTVTRRLGRIDSGTLTGMQDLIDRYLQGGATLLSSDGGRLGTFSLDARQDLTVALAEVLDGERSLQNGAHLSERSYVRDFEATMIRSLGNGGFAYETAVPGGWDIEFDERISGTNHIDPYDPEVLDTLRVDLGAFFDVDEDGSGTWDFSYSTMYRPGLNAQEEASNAAFFDSAHSGSSYLLKFDIDIRENEFFSVATGDGNFALMEYGNTGRSDTLHTFLVPIAPRVQGSNIPLRPGDNADDLRADWIVGGTGADTIHGYAGQDRLEGDEGGDEIHGGDHRDIVLGNRGHDTLYGDAGDDMINGGKGADLIHGGTGNDVIEGHQGNDTIHGDDGDDIIIGEVFGGNGFPTTYDPAQIPGEVFIALEFYDMLGVAEFVLAPTPFGFLALMVEAAANAADYLLDYYNIDDDTAEGWAAHTIVNGILFLTSPDAQLQALVELFSEDASPSFDDRIYGGAGHDILFGAQGKDRLWGGDGIDWLEGGEGDDILRGEAGEDMLSGGIGQDTLYGGTGNDLIEGQTGYDVLIGGAGNDVMRGGMGYDQLFGEAGDDVLSGDRGRDSLDGGDGNDYLLAGSQDILTGGAGADYFVFADVNTIGSRSRDEYFDGRGDLIPRYLYEENPALYPVFSVSSLTYTDHITDFNAAEGDRIALNTVDTGDIRGFKGLFDANGVLRPEHFRASTSGMVFTPDEYFAYDRDDRTLWYYENAWNSGPGVLIATFAEGTPDLTHADITDHFALL